MPQPRPSRILLISNGHGEDLNGGLIADQLLALRPDLELQALPIVGDGQAYRRRGIPLLHQGAPLPSGGMVYQGLNLWRDLAAGLVQQTLQQFWAAWRHGREADLVLCIGDHVPMAFAWLTGRPAVVFLVSTSSQYEGRLRLPGFSRLFCRRPAVRAVLTRDVFTARDLQSQGLGRARFCGYPIMDLAPAAGDQATVPLAIPAGSTPIALLPGSRFPECLHNLLLLTKLCAVLVQQDSGRRWCFHAAVLRGTEGKELAALAAAVGWTLEAGRLISSDGRVQVILRSDAFAPILRSSVLVLGMAGTAVEQAVGLGKPVVQIPGRGPQFSYAFAEAQMRLLGPAVFTVGQGPAGRAELEEAATLIGRLLADPELPARCAAIGLERVGPAGGSRGIARAVLEARRP
ncbi:MAG: lipid-A-disaccharide synthase-related protein [Cyanobacteriota bacterium]